MHRAPGSRTCPSALETDETAAARARLRFREHGIEAIEPDEETQALLAPGELLVAVRRSAVLEVRAPTASGLATQPAPGDLLVTTSRLLHRGYRTLSLELDSIEDAGMAGERLLLLLRGGGAVAVEADQPRLLRVQLAAARSWRAGSSNADRQVESR